MAATALSPGTARAQKRVPHVVYLWLGAPGSDGSTGKGFRTGLAELGYQAGRNLKLDERYANGSEARLAELAASAIAAQPDLIVTTGTVVTSIVAKLTRTVPIVSVTGDPVGSGFIASLAHPGGNITGMAITTGPELAEKWLELLSEIAPSARRIAMLRNARNLNSAAQLLQMRAAEAHRAIGRTIDEFAVNEAADLPSILVAIRQAKPDAIVVDNEPFIQSKRADIVALGLLAISGSRDFTDAGLLASYGSSIFDVYRRISSYVDRILKGAKPAELPVQQPTTYELVVNLKTAKALRLTIPPSILARADEVIE
ncbi:MAG: ABC transporter substrate-binding protein [Reyranella sp.]|nr:ABC transporter substrate-binding protein [Reyranella sp.]